MLPLVLRLLAWAAPPLAYKSTEASIKPLAYSIEQQTDTFIYIFFWFRDRRLTPGEFGEQVCIGSGILCYMFYVPYVDNSYGNRWFMT